MVEEGMVYMHNLWVLKCLCGELEGGGEEGVMSGAGVAQ